MLRSCVEDDLQRQQRSVVVQGVQTLVQVLRGREEAHPFFLVRVRPSVDCQVRRKAYVLPRLRLLPPCSCPVKQKDLRRKEEVGHRRHQVRGEGQEERLVVRKVQMGVRGVQLFLVFAILHAGFGTKPKMSKEID